MSNAEEFGDWLDDGARRHRRSSSRSTGRCRCGSTSWSAAGCYDLFADDAPATVDRPAAAARRPAPARVNPELRRLARDEPRVERAGAAAAAPAAAAGQPAPAARRRAAPSRADVIDRARRARACCRRSPSSSAGPAATPRSRSAWHAGLRLTTPDERERDPRGSSSARCADIPDEDLARARLLRVARRRSSAGVAAHHAGHAARPSRRSSRSCSAAAWSRSSSPPRPWRWASTCRPARVVLEKLVEVERRDPRRHHAGGVHPAHRPGRAARHRRRGPRRRALAAGPRPARRSAGLASTRTYPLRSQLPAVLQHGRQPGRPGRPRRAAREILETSFAQFQADRAVVGLARQVRRQRGGPGRATPRR